MNVARHVREEKLPDFRLSGFACIAYVREFRDSTKNSLARDKAAGISPECCDPQRVRGLHSGATRLPRRNASVRIVTATMHLARSRFQGVK